jgi:hypothetical protein
MQINGIVLSFDVIAGESLSGLVKECGFSAPETTDQGKITRKSSYEYSDLVEAERIGDCIFLTIHTKDFKSFGKAVNETIVDLKKVGLLT